MFAVKKNVKKSTADRLALLLILSSYALPNRILRLLEKVYFANKNIFGAERVLLFRKGGMGDAVSALTAIGIIKNNLPGAEIDLLTARRLPTQAGLEDIAEQGAFAKVFTYTTLYDKDLIRQLKDRGYDLYLELPSNIASFSFELRTMGLANKIGVKSGIGWRVSSTKFMAKKQERLLSFLNDNDRLVSILNEYGFDTGKREYGLKVPAPVMEKVHKLLVSKGLEDQAKNIALLTGAGRPQNKWPIGYFNEVATFYKDKGMNIILIGGAEEKEEAGKIQGSRMYNFCGELNAMESAALLKYCRLAISNDTGPMHLAYSVGTPVVAIFSARDYAGKWFPPDNNTNAVVRNTNVPCAICFSDRCMNNICMKAISPEMVIKQASAILHSQEVKAS